MTFWWNVDENPEGIDQWGGEPALNLNPAELVSLINGEKVTVVILSLDQIRARVKDLERQIQMSRVYAIQAVYPDDEVYDANDPRIDAEQGRLLNIWYSQMDWLKAMREWLLAKA